MSENIVYIDDEGNPIVDDDGNPVDESFITPDENLKQDYQSIRKANDGYASYWVDRFGGLKWSGEGLAKYQEALRTVSRTVNLTTNQNVDAGKKEREIVVRWSNGQNKNTVNDDVVYLSPDLIKKETRRPGWSDLAVVDVLVGNALIESAYKATASPEAESRIALFHYSDFDTARNEQKIWATLGQQLWYAAECLAAQEKVLQEFPGFSCYFQASKDYFTHPDALGSLCETLRDGAPTVQKAVLATLWNLIWEDELDLPEEYEAEVESAVHALRQVIATCSNDRANCTFIILENFRRAFRLDKPDDEAGDGGSGGDGEDEAPEELDIGQHSSFLEAVENTTGLHQALARQTDAPENEEKVSIDKIFAPDGSSFTKNFSENMVYADRDYGRKRSEVLPLIKALRNRLKIRSEDLSYYERGLRRGELDEGSLYKLGYAPHGIDDPRVFEQKNIVTKPDAAFIILVDESGSMSSLCQTEADPITGQYESTEIKCVLARKAAIVAAEALREMEGVKLAVLGHTAYSDPPRLHLNHYLTPKNQAGLSSLGHITANDNNVDGYAIQRACMYMMEWFRSAPTKMIIHISDGLPQYQDHTGNSYGGAQGRKHVQKVCKTAAQQGIKVISLGIDCAALNSTAMQEMYGAKNWALLKNATQLPLVLSNLITQTLKRDLHL